MSNPNDIVAVKLEGCFTEWYSPNYKEPFEDNEEYRKYYEEHIIDKQPVIGPVLGGEDGHFLSDDLSCVAERLCCDSLEHWQRNTDDLCSTIEMCLAADEYSTRIIRLVDGKITEVKITPVTKAELPPLTDDALKVFGDFGWLIRERYNAI